MEHRTQLIRARLLALTALIVLPLSLPLAAAPVISNCPGHVLAHLCSVTKLALAAVPSPGCEQLTWSVTALGPQPVNGVAIDSTGTLSVRFGEPDGGNMFTFRVIVSDDCGLADTCQILMETAAEGPFIFKIGKLPSTLFGRTVTVPITQEQGSRSIASFDFLIAYEACVLNLVGASLGAALGDQGCNWEYFTYNIIDPGTYTGVCQDGLVRLRAYANLNNGDPAPGCYMVAPGDTLATISFYLTHNYWHECEFSPIRFAWQTCGDNTLLSEDLNFSYGACRVFDAFNTNPTSDPNYELTDTDCDRPLHFGGECGACDEVAAAPVMHFAYFWDGGIELQCLDPLCVRGDLNLNRIAYEIGDVHLYANYFIYGMAALDPDPGRRSLQICGADINGDGVTPSLPDLILLARIFANDTLSIPPDQGFKAQADVTFENGILSVATSEGIAGIWARFSVSGPVDPANLSDLDLRSGVGDDGTFRVLLTPPLAAVSNHLAAGIWAVFALNPNSELLDIELVSASGQEMIANIKRPAMPQEFVLDQNFPNPFNPVTKITFALPIQSDWTLEIVNVAGQVVEMFTGRNVGLVSLDWDARDCPSGVYLYRLANGSSTLTRKMILLK